MLNNTFTATTCQRLTNLQLVDSLSQARLNDPGYLNALQMEDDRVIYMYVEEMSVSLVLFANRYQFTFGIIVCRQIPVYILYYCLRTGTNFHFVVLFADRYQFKFCIISLKRIAGPVQAWYIINRCKPLVVITFVRLLEHVLQKVPVPRHSLLIPLCHVCGVSIPLFT